MSAVNGKKNAQNRNFVTPGIEVLPWRKYMTYAVRGGPPHRCDLDAIGLTHKPPGEVYGTDEPDLRGLVVFRYTLRGAAELRDLRTGRVRRVEEGRAFLFADAPPTRWQSAPGQPWDILWVNLIGDAALHHAQAIVGEHGAVFPLHPEAEPVRILVNLHSQAAQDRLPGRHLLSAEMYRFLMALRTELEEGHSASPAKRPPLVNQAAALFDADFSDSGLDVTAAARRLGCSRCHLSRVFQAATGQTPHAYLTEVRLRTALRLVVETRMPVAEVARRCGFADASYFGKVFRRQFGDSPRRVRIRRSQFRLSEPGAGRTQVHATEE